MEPLLIMVPGLVGGLAIAVLFLRQRRAGRGTDPFSRDGRSTDVINMAHVRVAGVGGLGLVAMATLVALYVPAIRVAILLGLVLGGVFAAGLIAWRRRGGPMPSSGRRPGANTTLAIDAAPSQPDTEAPRREPDLHAVPATLQA